MEEVKSKLDAGINLVIIDSRSENSYDQSHIVGAISIPLDIMAEPYNDFIGYEEIAVEAEIATVSHEHRDHNYVAGLKGNPQAVKDAGGLWGAGVPKEYGGVGLNQLQRGLWTAEKVKIGQSTQ